DADSSIPPRFFHPSLARTPRCSEAYLHWRSPSATLSLSIHATRALVPSHIKDDATDDEVAVDRDVEAGVDACIGMEVNFGVDAEDEVEDEVESSDRGTIEVGVDVVVGVDIPDAMPMHNIPLQWIEDIETGHRESEARSLIAGGERASLLEQVASLERSNARLRGTMMTERARDDRFRRRAGFIESELRQIQHDYHSFWLKAKAKMTVTAIMEMVEIEMVEMEMVEMEMVKMKMAEMKIQMRIIGVLGLLLESVPTKTL
ncbi:hypothetical protein Tco_1169107, partial [Tanacetum coccineum]